MDMKSVGASDPGLETLAMAFNDLSSKSNQTQVAAAERFRRFMEVLSPIQSISPSCPFFFKVDLCTQKQSRKLTADKFERLASRLTGKIIDLVNVADVQGKIGGIMVIGMLTEQLAVLTNGPRSAYQPTIPHLAGENGSSNRYVLSSNFPAVIRTLRIRGRVDFRICKNTFEYGERDGERGEKERGEKERGTHGTSPPV
eukprot:1320521-Amorphochlora_amoeboformis.AAC.1